MKTDDIIKKIWDSQGFGNVAVWQDGTMTVVSPGDTGKSDEKAPIALFKPLALVAGYPMLDHALGDKALRGTIETTIRDAGGEISGD
ncbi:MAG TPA: hypothetical protein VMW63_11310 [Methanoregulaceae archaeon]|nr:hypothetical protein [Methanoregulaceae archaeon]